jgi:hypothetical protein
MERILKLRDHDLVKNKTLGITLISDHASNKFTADGHDWYA